MHRFMSLLLLLGSAQLAWTAEPTTDILKRFLDEQTLAVVHVDVGKLDAKAIATRITELIGENRPVASVLREFKAVQDLLATTGIREVYVLVSLADFPSQPPFVVMPVADAGKAARQLGESKHFPAYRFQAMGPVVVGASTLTLERLGQQTGAPRPELGTALRATGDAAVRVAVALSADQRRVLESLVPNLPPELGGGSIQTLTRGVRWLAIGIQPPPVLSLRIVMQSPDATAAQALSDLATRTLKEISTRLQQENARGPQAPTQPPDFGRLAAQLKPRVEGDRMIIAPEAKELLALLAPLAVRVQQAAGRAQSANNLKQIGLAMHNYHDAHKAFPAIANFSKGGRPLLSWRVHILPFLEAGDLYNQFHLDEPWDSEHNKKLIARMPPTFRSPASRAEPGKTRYLVPVGEAMIFTGSPNGTPIRAITDGTSHTILAVEVNDEKAVIWTKPDDWEPDPQKPLAGLLGVYANGFLTLFADGSVRMQPATIDLKKLTALLTRNGGEIVTNE